MVLPRSTHSKPNKLGNDGVNFVDDNLWNMEEVHPININAYQDNLNHYHPSSQGEPSLVLARQLFAEFRNKPIPLKWNTC